MTTALGIVGAGVMGARFAATAAAGDDFSVTAIADPMLSRAEDVARATGASAFETIEALAESGVADAVYIGVPHHLHADACETALRSGLHVLIDKPLCNTRDEAARILAARDASGRAVMVGFSYRFRAEWMRAREWIAGGAIGRPLQIADTLFEAQAVTPSWYWDEAAGGGVIQLQSHHCFDRLAWLADAPFAAVSCRTLTGESTTAETAAMINAELAGGALASIDIGFGIAYGGHARATTIVQGTHGHVVIDSVARTAVLAAAENAVEQVAAEDDDWLARELEVFAAACRGGSGGPSAEDGVAALGCALAAKKSARVGGDWVEV